MKHFLPKSRPSKYFEKSPDYYEDMFRSLYKAGFVFVGFIAYSFTMLGSGALLVCLVPLGMVDLDADPILRPLTIHTFSLTGMLVGSRYFNARAELRRLADAQGDFYEFDMQSRERWYLFVHHLTCLFFAISSWICFFSFFEGGESLDKTNTWAVISAMLLICAWIQVELVIGQHKLHRD